MQAEECLGRVSYICCVSYIWLLISLCWVLFLLWWEAHFFIKTNDESIKLSYWLWNKELPDKTGLACTTRDFTVMMCHSFAYISVSSLKRLHIQLMRNFNKKKKVKDWSEEDHQHLAPFWCWIRKYYSAIILITHIYVPYVASVYPIV